MASRLDEIHKRCEELELDISVGSVEYWQAQIANHLALTSALVLGAVDEIGRVITRELKGIIFMHIGRDVHKEMPPMHAVCEELDERGWPIAPYNLHAAYWCYAADQHTACVFHAMRASEKVLTSIALELGIDGSRENWQNIIESIESKIKNLDSLPKGADRMEKQTFYSEIAMQLRYIKNAWRNHVMHGRTTYDATVAKQIWWHVAELIRSSSVKNQEQIEL